LRLSLKIKSHHLSNDKYYSIRTREEQMKEMQFTPKESTRRREKYILNKSALCACSNTHETRLRSGAEIVVVVVVFCVAGLSVSFVSTMVMTAVIMVLLIVIVVILVIVAVVVRVLVVVVVVLANVVLVIAA